MICHVFDVISQEEESIKRRRSAAKDAVAGHRPSIYEQLLSRYGNSELSEYLPHIPLSNPHHLIPTT